MKAAVVQLCSGHDPDTNIQSIQALVTEAAEQGARYVQTPEMSLCLAGNRAKLAQFSGADILEEAALKFSRLARKLKIFLHIGSMAVPLESGRFFNRSVLFGPDGQPVGQYDKIHLFDADLDEAGAYRESEMYEPGNTATMVPVGPFELGMTICYDVRFPALYARMAQAGADLFAIPSAFTVPTGQAHWSTLVRARAIENGAFVVAAAQGGHHENGRTTYGHSMIVDPWGQVLAEIDHDRPGFALASLDPAASALARKKVPNLANLRGFSLSVNHDLPR
ncbi:MAG: carbon-nitrogen hydrolase family protein [Alphaproteobacteria bacterium]|nr:carbon-nitrogen hydrolase family protein [Alphaproteobacteria bacterium]